MDGWPIVGWATVFVAIVVAGVLAVHGLGEEGARVALRSTARTSLLFFLGAFLASPLRKVVDSPFSRWLAANRRYLGVSFAVSHTFHFAAIMALFRLVDERPDMTTLVGGYLGFAFAAAMAATSFDSTAALLGQRAWKALHKTGLFYLWFIFTFTYVDGAVHGHPSSAVSFALLVGALIFRIWVAAMGRGRAVG